MDLLRSGAKFGEDLSYRFASRNCALLGKAHANRLLWIDRDGVENDLVLTALNIEHVEQVFHADVVRREGGRIIARELRRSARHRADRVTIRCRVNNDDTIGVFKRFKQSETAGPAIKTFNTGRHWMFFKLADCVDTDAFVAHQDVAKAKYERFNFCGDRSPRLASTL